MFPAEELTLYEPVCRHRRNRLKRQPDPGIDALGAVMHVPLFIDFEVLAMWQISKANSDLMAEKNLLDIG